MPLHASRLQHNPYTRRASPSDARPRAIQIPRCTLQNSRISPSARALCAQLDAATRETTLVPFVLDLADRLLFLSMSVTFVLLSSNYQVSTPFFRRTQ